MDFKLNSEQQMLRDSVRRYLERSYDFETRLAALKGRVAGSGGHWQAFAEAGWLAAALPEEYGGLSGSIIDTALIAEEFGRALVVEPYAACAVAGAQTVLAAGREDQRVRWMPALADGSRRVALAYSEPQSRGLPGPIATRAVRASGGFRLNGLKTLVMGGVEADGFIVSALLDEPGQHPSAQTLFLVDADRVRSTCRPLRLHDGSRACELELDEVFVDEGAVLGETGRGLAALRAGLSAGMAALSAELVGVMERALEITAEYLKTRSQFGVRIGSFQSLQHRMADMATELEVARSMLYSLLAAMSSEDVDTRWIAACRTKALVARSARWVCGQAIQLHGGIGMTEEYAVGHHFKRAVVADLAFGAADRLDAHVAESRVRPSTAAAAARA